MRKYILETITKLFENIFALLSFFPDWVPLLNHNHNERLQM